MKPTGAVLQAPPARPVKVQPRPAAPARKRLRLSELRRLRDRLQKSGEVGQALEAAREVAERDPGRESYFTWGLLQREVGRFRDALSTLRTALKFKSGPAYLVPEIHVQIASAWHRLGERKRMLESLRRAYRAGRKPRSAPFLHHTLGSYYMQRRRYKEALSEFARAEAAYDTAANRGRAAMNQALAMMWDQQLDQANRHLDRAYRHLKAGRCRLEIGGIHMIRAGINADQGKRSRSLELHLRAYRVFRGLGNVHREAAALCSAGYAAVELGMWPRSRALLTRAIRLSASCEEWLLEACSHALRAIACAEEDDFERATEDLARARQLMKGRWDWRGTLHVSRAQARIAAIFADWKRVKRIARKAECLAEKSGDIPRVKEFRTLRGVAEANLGRHRAAGHARKSVARMANLQGTHRPSSRVELEQVARRLARTSLTLLITGEPGTGKSQLARKLHAWSGRRRGPCVEVPCEQLVFAGSELGGHVAGAWSGARNGSRGYARMAEGGTLVLDRVDELDAEDQRHLLRMLDGQVRTVGNGPEEKIDVRVVATCRNPELLLPSVRKRLEGARLRVPPLRETPDEIRGRLLKLINGRRRITVDALAWLSDRPWPGNQAELEAVSERLIRGSQNAIGLKLARRVAGDAKSRRPLIARTPVLSSALYKTP